MILCLVTQEAYSSESKPSDDRVVCPDITLQNKGVRVCGGRIYLLTIMHLTGINFAILLIKMS